jgi:hypothetical protein
VWFPALYRSKAVGYDIPSHDAARIGESLEVGKKRTHPHDAKVPALTGIISALSAEQVRACSSYHCPSFGGHAPPAHS